MRYGREARGGPDDPPETHESLASSDRRSEWHAQLEAWADRLDAAKDDADKLDELCAEIDWAVGQGKAWQMVGLLATCIRLYLDCPHRERHRTAARAAILSIPMPEENDE